MLVKINIQSVSEEVEIAAYDVYATRVPGRYGTLAQAASFSPETARKMANSLSYEWNGVLRSARAIAEE